MNKFQLMIGVGLCAFGGTVVGGVVIANYITGNSQSNNNQNIAQTPTLSAEFTQMPVNNSNPAQDELLIDTNVTNVAFTSLPPKPTPDSTDLALTQPIYQDNVNFISDGNLSFVHGKGTNGLVSIPKQYTHKNELVHNNVLNPLLNMIAAARQDGIKLSVVSAYRPYDHQKRIWERKWGNSPNNDIQKAKSILTLSSFPGTSRHHWGTDIDFNSVSDSYWQSGEGKKTYQWLANNAPAYGFCQTYNAGRTQGYDVEAWHWSHIPTARAYFAEISKPEVLQIALAQNIKGGAAAKQLADTIMTHVVAINPNCQNITQTKGNNTANVQQPSQHKATNQNTQSNLAIQPTTIQPIQGYPTQNHPVQNYPTQNNPVQNYPSQQHRPEPNNNPKQPSISNNQTYQQEGIIITRPTN